MTFLNAKMWIIINRSKTSSHRTEESFHEKLTANVWMNMPVSKLRSVGRTSSSSIRAPSSDRFLQADTSNNNTVCCIPSVFFELASARRTGLGEVWHEEKIIVALPQRPPLIIPPLSSRVLKCQNRVTELVFSCRRRRRRTFASFTTDSAHHNTRCCCCCPSKLWRERLGLAVVGDTDRPTEDCDVVFVYLTSGGSDGIQPGAVRGKQQQQSTMWINGRECVLNFYYYHFCSPVHERFLSRVLWRLRSAEGCIQGWVCIRVGLELGGVFSFSEVGLYFKVHF